MTDIFGRSVDRREVERLQDPPVARDLFGRVRRAWLWLVVRLSVDWVWLSAGWEKLGNPAWTGDNGTIGGVN